MKQTKTIKILSLICLVVLLSQIVLAEVFPSNSTGWAQLENGSLIQSSWTLYTFYLGTWFFTILFFMFQFMLLLKARSPTLGLFTTGLVLGVSISKSLLSPVAMGFISVYAVGLITWILTKLIINDRPN